MEIHDPRKWRISRSGFSIKSGWSDATRTIAAYPGKAHPLDETAFQAWVDDAQLICDLRNAALDAPMPND